ncbi:variable surface protein [Plasmodium gonderi]|uniref:Variable surface protein n=1 Tax=Plasmodium gonderi TaxID=77519 RepID=A0A1Y1JVK1_PLAGO|nr:variable surface protein [Plasmodium gonderi]GAW84403.1 variable surface protein [Plasmodium gonderi]
MITSIVIDDNQINFEDIFPQCMYDYDKHAKCKVNLESDDINNTCRHIKKQLGSKDSVANFLQYCRELIHYLDYIERINSPAYKKTSCIFFYYILSLLLKSSNYSVNQIHDAYHKMISETNEDNMKKVSNVCQNDFKNLGNNIYLTLHKLNELYEIVSGTRINCSEQSPCYAKYKELSEICNRSKNISLCRVLKNFENAYMTYLPYVQEILNLRISLKNTRIIILTFLIIPFTILIITLFLYKYTPYGSFLLSTVRKIRRILKKKNKDHLNIMDSSEFTQHNVFHNVYQIE